METTKKTKKPVKTKPKANKVGRPRKVKLLSVSECLTIADKLKPVQEDMKHLFGFEPTIMQTLDYCVHTAEREIGSFH